MNISIITWQIALQCFLCLCIALGVAGIFGHALFIAGKRRQVYSWRYLFECLVLGLTACCSLYAIIICKGQTILLPCPVLALLYVRSYPVATGRNNTGATPFKGKWLLLSMTVAAFAAWVTVFICPVPGYVQSFGNDQTYYATVAVYINKLGLENNHLDFLNAGRYTVSLYHYGDIYITSLVAAASGINTSMVLTIVAYPFLSVIACVGLLAIYESVFMRSLQAPVWGFAIVVILLVASGFTFLYPRFILDWNKYDNSYYNYPKYLFPAILLTGILLALLQRRFLSSGVLTATGILLYTTAAPMLFLGNVILSFLLWRRKKIQFRALAINYALTCSSIAFVFIFYKMLSKVEANELYKPYYRLFALSDIKTVIGGIAVSNLLQLSCYILHGLLFFLLFRHLKKAGSAHVAGIKTSGILAFLFAYLLAGYLGMMAVYNISYDYLQLYTFILVNAANMGIAIMYIYLFTRRVPYTYRVAGAAMLAINIIYSHFIDSPLRFHNRQALLVEEFRQARDFVCEKEPRFAEITVTASDNAPYAINSQLWKPLYFFSYYYEPYICAAINTVEAKIEEKPRAKYYEEYTVNLMPFTYYYVAHGGTPASYQDLQLQFMHDNGIHYLYARRGVALSPVISAAVTDSLLLTREGLRIFHLKL